MYGTLQSKILYYVLTLRAKFYNLLNFSKFFKFLQVFKGSTGFVCGSEKDPDPKLSEESDPDSKKWFRSATLLKSERLGSIYSWNFSCGNVET